MSREVDLYKDKIEVSLDGRQIFYLFFGGAVIVGLVFVLGVMVGRRVEARGHVDRANLTTAADPLAALDRLESGGNRLSFQDSLRGNETPETDVEKQIATMQKKEEPAKKEEAKLAKADKKDEAKTEAAAKADGKKVEAKAGEKLEAKAGEKLEAKAGEKLEAKTDVKAEAKKVEAKSDAKTYEKTEEKKLDAKVDQQKLEAKADAKTDEKQLDAKVDEKKLDAKADAKTDAKTDEKKVDEKKQKFTLQLSSFQDKNEAQAYLDSVKASGYQAYVTEGAVEGKQFFRVRMGSYKSIEAANDAKSEFEKSAKKSAIVTKL
jgi:DedD protein